MPTLNISYVYHVHNICISIHFSLIINQYANMNLDNAINCCFQDERPSTELMANLIETKSTIDEKMKSSKVSLFRDSDMLDNKTL